MCRNTFLQFFAEIWPKKITSRDGCVLLKIYYLISCQSRFSGVYLVFKVFQDIWYSNKRNPGKSWSATLSCPSTASNYVNWHLVLISFYRVSGKSGARLFLPCSQKMPLLICSQKLGLVLFRLLCQRSPAKRFGEERLLVTACCA